MIKIDKKIWKNIIKDFDYFLVAVTLITTIYGMIVISSATNNFNNNTRFIFVQSLGLGIGFCFIVGCTFLDYNYLKSFVKPIFVLNIVALLAVFFFGVGEEYSGASRWIDIGSFTIQPSEIIKIGFIITFASHLDYVKENIHKFRTLALALLHVGVLAGLIMIQPDLGTALALVFIAIGMLFVAGISYKHILIMAASAAVFIPVSWLFLLHGYQKQRILVFLNPDLDPLGSGYHVIQSKIAVGSGQLFGRGLYEGTQSQLGFLPEKHTDFIFAVIGEELGMIGATVVILLLITIIIRCIATARIAKDDFGSLLCIGVASMIAFQTFQNAGMCIGLMPITGIPLPFISYGANALITNLAGLALVINVRIRRKIINF